MEEGENKYIMPYKYRSTYDVDTFMGYEICAYQPAKRRWLRLSGTLVDDDRREPKQAMLDAHPSLKRMYSADDANTQVLYFAPGATATIDSFPDTHIVLKF